MKPKFYFGKKTDGLYHVSAEKEDEIFHLCTLKVNKRHQWKVISTEPKGLEQKFTDRLFSTKIIAATHVFLEIENDKTSNDRRGKGIRSKHSALSRD